MQYNDTPLFGQEIEHQFVHNVMEQEIAREELEERLRDAEKQGARKERHRIHKENEKKKKAIISWIVGIPICVVLVFSLSCLYQCLSFVYDNIDRVWFGVVVVGILTTVGTCLIKEESLRTQRGDDETFLLGAWRELKAVCKLLFRNNFYILLLFLCIVILFGGVTGKFDVFARFTFASKKFMVAFRDYDKGIEGEENAEEVMDQNIPEAAWQILKNYEGDSEEIKQMKIYPNEIDLVLNLSDAERGIVFFTQGDYAIEDWDDQEEINDKVLRMVEDARKTGLVNKFEDFAPQEIKNDISKASDDEMDVECFSDVKNINTIRSDIYTVYPKKSIANLISNGNQKLALILMCHNGKQVTILYYYAQAVIWEMEFIRYSDISNSTVKEHLNKIAQRYKDIEKVCLKCDEVRYAEKLHIAFENAANQY